ETKTAEVEFAEPAAPAAPRRAQGFYYVQLGTFSREELAQEKRAEVESRIAVLEDESIAPFLAPVTDRSGRAAYAVRVGPFPTRGAAREAAAGYGRASVVWSSSGRAL
ncbi:MAG TPA: SPOR domain-containing protein, partial [Thermoanaerobaculia bacterium]|nr:SPOR domain-containing protein [Thermoanaerobaculia bacterium]